MDHLKKKGAVSTATGYWPQPGFSSSFFKVQCIGRNGQNTVVTCEEGLKTSSRRVPFHPNAETRQSLVEALSKTGANHDNPLGGRKILSAGPSIESHHLAELEVARLPKDWTCGLCISPRLPFSALCRKPHCGNRPSPPRVGQADPWLSNDILAIPGQTRIPSMSYV